METRRFGRTGHMSAIVTLGGAALGRVSQDEADRTIRLAMKHGVNHIDIAPSYGEAELRVGPWMEQSRDKFFLGCKTTKRTKAEAWEELRKSLDRLRVKSFDLYQFHAVNDFENLEAIFARGGAMEAFLEAREQGLTRHIGITGHGMQCPTVQLEALRRFNFDTLLFPVNYVLFGRPDYRASCETLIKTARDKDVGTMAIKSIARGPWGDRPRTFATWYEPFDTQAEIDRSFWFALSQEVTTAPHAGDISLVPMVLDAGERFRRLNASEQSELIGIGASYETMFAA